VYAKQEESWKHVDESDYTLSRSADSGVIGIDFAEPVTASGVKVHCLWDERNSDYRISESYANFKNRADRILAIRYIDRNRTTSYGYDAEGKRTTETTTDSLGGTTNKSYTYWVNTDHCKTDGRYAYVYDVLGNLIEKGTDYTATETSITYSPDSGIYWKYTYDLWGHLTTVEKSEAGTGNGVTIMRADYDADGILRTKTKGAKVWRYWYGSDGTVLYQTMTDTLTPATSWEKSFTYVSGKLVSYTETRNEVATRYWTMTDQLGSVVRETDETGAVVASNEYASFGANPDTGAGSVHEPLTWYTGKEWDEDVCLYYFNARWYDPELGRFITEDPARDDSNWYVYCLNSPETWIDPSGMYHYSGSEMVSDEGDTPGKDGAGYSSVTPYSSVTSVTSNNDGSISVNYNNNTTHNFGGRRGTLADGSLSNTTVTNPEAGTKPSTNRNLDMGLTNPWATALDIGKLNDPVGLLNGLSLDHDKMAATLFATLSKNNQKKIGQLHPLIRNTAIFMFSSLLTKGYNVEIVCAYRSFEDQDKQWARGRDKNGKAIIGQKTFTNAKGGESYHQYGLAFDIEVYDNNGKKNWDFNGAMWQKVIAEGKDKGFVSGSLFNDYPHFEYSFGMPTSVLYSLYKGNQMTGGFVNVF